VAALLPPQREAHLREGLGALSAGDPRQLRHTASISVSKRSSGTGRLSCSSAAT
jgi:hypothetical protein